MPDRSAAVARCGVPFVERFASALFVVVALEAFLGGGGRLFEIGPLTLRMLLFGVAMITTVLLLATRGRLDAGVRVALGLTVVGMLVHAGPVAIGLLSGNSRADVAVDLKPLAYLAMAPFFASTLGTRADANRVVHLVTIAASILAVLYLVAFGLLASGIVANASVYHAFVGTGEIMFRSEATFFYKGFLYLAVGLVFVLSGAAGVRRAAAVPIGAALLLTMTRGLIMSAALGVVVLLGLRDRRALLAALPIAAAVSFGVLWVLPALNWSYSEQRAISNAIRGDDVTFFLENADVVSLLFGSGFGTPLNGRMLIENTYLWLIWKAGLGGIAFWFAPLALCMRAAAQAWRRPAARPATAAFLSASVVVYALSATNPFLLNPIGMSIVLISMSCLHTLGRTARHA